MSVEHLSPEQWELPHEDHEALIAINGVARAFSTADSAYWQYPERYRAFDHLIKWLADNGDYELYFDLDQDDVDTLHEAGITWITPPYPNEQVKAQFWAVQMTYYDRELKFHEATGKIPGEE